MQKRIISVVLSAAMLGTSVFSVPFVNAETTAKTGDIDASGMIDVTDLTELSLALLGDRNLSEDQKKAADVDGDGAVTLADLAKFRQYLSKKISRREFENITLESIVDITERDGLSIPAAIEKFYEDEYFKYEFGGIKSSYVECTFSDGSKMNVKEALESGMVTISDLDKYKIDYRRTTEMTAVVKEVKSEQLVLIPAEGSKELKSSDLIVADYVYASEQKYKAGDTVVVEYDGYIYETYPAQIVASSVRIINSGVTGDITDISDSCETVTVGVDVEKWGSALKSIMISSMEDYDEYIGINSEENKNLAKKGIEVNEDFFKTNRLAVMVDKSEGCNGVKYTLTGVKLDKDGNVHLYYDKEIPEFMTALASVFHYVTVVPASENSESETLVHFNEIRVPFNPENYGG